MGRSNVTECVLLWSSSSSSNNNSSSSSCKWVNWRACSVLVTLVCLVVVPLHCGVMVTAQATSPSKPGSSSSRRNDVNPPPHVHHIAALLEAANHSSTQAAFLEAISAANRDPHSPVTLQGVSLAQQTDPPFYLAYICDAILNHERHDVRGHRKPEDDQHSVHSHDVCGYTSHRVQHTSSSSCCSGQF